MVLPCHVTGIPQPVVTWYKDGLEVHFVLQSKFTLKGNDLIIGDIVEEDFGVFKCKAENYLNSTEQVFELSVNGTVTALRDVSYRMGMLYNPCFSASYDHYPSNSNSF